MDVIPSPRTRANLNVPNELKSYRHFVCWRLSQTPGKIKPDKLPIDPATGALASTTDPSTWSDYETACRACEAGGYDGIGFVFCEYDPFVFFDLDDCRDPASGAWLPHAQAIFVQLSNAAWETSQSGKGRHGVARVSDKGAFASKSNRWKDANGFGFEFYAVKRFVAFGQCDWTRFDLVGDCGNAVAACVPDRQAKDRRVIEWDDKALPDYAGPSDDNDLIERALASRGGLVSLGHSPSFSALWHADATELGKYYPDSGGRLFDHSAADLALANHLAWWTGCNPVRIERLISGSPLGVRAKWQTRADYRARTIMAAISDPTRPYMQPADRRAQQLQIDIEVGDDLPMQPLPSIMSLKDMERGLIHIGFGSQIVHRGSKTLRAKDDAASEYAASVTELDTGKVDKDGKPITRRRQTLELWRCSPNRISVDVATWQPSEPEICKALETTGSGQRAYNLWTPPRLLPPPNNWGEWVKPFLDHVDYLVPVKAERQRFLQWLAHIFQKPGELPHTAYLMVATTTGIGRGTLASIITRALRGYVAANVDVGILLNNNFNGRLSQKLLATVDEIREGGTERYRQQENFKSAVVEEERHINPKFGRQYVEKNCCRWLLFSNHMDAIPFDNSDRRVVVIANPDTPAEPEWFEYLHRIMNETAFVASVQHYLSNLDIRDFRPGERAPMNEAKRIALARMESPADTRARQFALTWPGTLATVADLREFLGDDAPSHSAAIKHIIERAGMKSGRQLKILGKVQTSLLVRGPLTVSDLDGIDSVTMAADIVASQSAFRSIV